MTSGSVSSTGLSSRVAATLAYAGWWVTGLIVWFIERRDAYVRFHAAQSCIAFGAIAGLVTILALAGAAALIYMPAAYAVWFWAAGVCWVAGLVLWGGTLWYAATGRPWRIPVAAPLADRLCRRWSAGR